MQKEDILRKCTIDGYVLKLPDIQLERSLYQQVAKSLELIGGKWKGGKIKGFVFNSDPSFLLSQITNGEKRNIQKEYQFFPTPKLLAQQMVELAEIEEYDLVLEPSAGQGAIINAIHDRHSVLVHYCELMEINRSILSAIQNTVFLKENFLLVNTPNLFHKIIANPPFTKNQDIEHIMHMYHSLAPGGRIVSVCSKHWEYSNNKKELAFKKFLNEKKTIITPIPAKTFSESGTNIETNLIVINK